MTNPSGHISGHNISALRGCCALIFLSALEIDQGYLAHTPTVTGVAGNPSVTVRQGGASNSCLLPRLPVNVGLFRFLCIKMPTSGYMYTWMLDRHLWIWIWMGNFISTASLAMQAKPNTGTTRMVQLPATAAIEYVAACCRTRTRTRTKTKTVRGAYARSPQVQCVYTPSRLSVPSVVA